MYKGSQKEVLIGTVLGTLLGTAGSAVLSNKEMMKKVKAQTQHWFDKAKDLGGDAYEGLKNINNHQDSNHFAYGALAGFLLGAGSTLFLTPTTGKDFRKEVKKKYKSIAAKTQDIVDYIKEEQKPIKRGVITALHAVARTTKAVARTTKKPKRKAAVRITRKRTVSVKRRAVAR